MNFYSEYKGRCVGRLLHFLSRYTSWHRDCTFIDNNKIMLYGHLFATYTWDNDSDVPTFVFVEAEDPRAFHRSMAKFCVENQSKLKEHILEDDLICAALLKLSQSRKGETMVKKTKQQSVVGDTLTTTEVSTLKQYLQENIDVFTEFILDNLRIEEIKGIKGHFTDDREFALTFNGQHGATFNFSVKQEREYEG
jgi:hypothetical protein